jgi:hypothetical protein
VILHTINFGKIYYQDDKLIPNVNYNFSLR